MTPAERTELADRVMVNWPHAHRGAWVEILEPCEFHLAERTLKVLRDRLMRMPDIVEFAGEYDVQGTGWRRMSDEECQQGLERVAQLRAQLPSAATRGPI